MSNEKRNITKVVLNGIWVTVLCHSLCCILPIFGVVVGLNILGDFLSRYEEWFISLNIVAMLGGFYLTHIHKKKKHCDHKNCHSDNMKTYYWIATGVSLFLIFLSH